MNIRLGTARLFGTIDSALANCYQCGIDADVKLSIDFSKDSINEPLIIDQEIPGASKTNRLTLENSNDVIYIADSTIDKKRNKTRKHFFYQFGWI